MKRYLIQSDFSESSLAQYFSQISVAAFFLLIIVLGLGGLFFWKTIDMYRSSVAYTNQISAVQMKLDLLDQQSVKQKIKLAMPIVSVEKARAINQVIASLNLPWSDILNAIEDGAVTDVTVLNLEPQALAKIVKISAEAKTTEEMFAYVEKLGRHPFFRIALLTKHETYEQDPKKPIRFSVEVSWDEGVKQ